MDLGGSDASSSLGWFVLKHDLVWELPQVLNPKGYTKPAPGSKGERVPGEKTGPSLPGSSQPRPEDNPLDVSLEASHHLLLSAFKSPFVGLHVPV